jgi:hypothetical protein
LTDGEIASIIPVKKEIAGLILGDRSNGFPQLGLRSGFVRDAIVEVGKGDRVEGVGKVLGFASLNPAYVTIFPAYYSSFLSAPIPIKVAWFSLLITGQGS